MAGDPTLYNPYRAPPTGTDSLSRGGRSRTRPRILTAVGVFSIIIGSLGLLGSFSTGMAGLSVLRSRQRSIDQARNAVYQPSVPSPAGSQAVIGPTSATPIATVPDRAAPEGMDAADRQVMLGVLDQIETMSPEQTRQLDAILSTHGWELFPIVSKRLNTPTVVAAVREHGTLPSARAKEPDPVFFRTSSGRLELYADRALFRPEDGTTPIRSSLPSPSDATQSGVQTEITHAANSAGPSDPPAQMTSGAGPGTQFAGIGTKLSVDQVQAVLQKAQQTSQNKLNPAQMAALKRILSDPAQDLVSTASVWSPISLAIVQPDGSALLKFEGGYLMLDAHGNVSSQGPVKLSAVAVKPLAISGLMGESLLAFVLAGLLVLAGILVMRQNRWGGVMHLIYAVAKIPVAVVGGLALAWVIAGCEQSNFSRGSNGSSEAGTVWGIIVGGLGVLYPVVLLVVLFTRSVREYQKGLNG